MRRTGSATVDNKRALCLVWIGHCGTSRKSRQLGRGGTKTGSSNGDSCTASKPRIDTAATVKISSAANCGRGFSRCTAAHCDLGNEREQQDGDPLSQHRSIVAQHHRSSVSSVDRRTKPIDEFPLEEIGDKVYQLAAGGGGARALLFCCSVDFEEPAINPLLELMPSALLVRGAATHDATLRVLLDTMAGEVTEQRVGAATVLTRLADVVITRVIRMWVEARGEDATGWLAAIRDPKIGRALAAIHRRPGHAWSVEALADIAHVSRSMFSERFMSAVGVPPARYLSRWRMHLASIWLRNNRRTVSEVAAELGYESDASFSRAFKRYTGLPPSAVRQLKPAYASKRELEPRSAINRSRARDSLAR